MYAEIYGAGLVEFYGFSEGRHVCRGEYLVEHLVGHSLDSRLGAPVEFATLGVAIARVPECEDDVIQLIDIVYLYVFCDDPVIHRHGGVPFYLGAVTGNVAEHNLVFVAVDNGAEVEDGLVAEIEADRGMEGIGCVNLHGRFPGGHSVAGLLAVDEPVCEYLEFVFFPDFEFLISPVENGAGQTAHGLGFVTAGHVDVGEDVLGRQIVARNIFCGECQSERQARMREVFGDFAESGLGRYGAVGRLAVHAEETCIPVSILSRLLRGLEVDADIVGCPGFNGCEQFT